MNMGKMGMRACIEAAPKVLRAQLERGEELIRPLSTSFESAQPRRLVLVASGSSYTAAWMARPYLVRVLGVSVEVTFPYTFAEYDVANLGDDAYALVISQSGASVNCLDALRAAKKAGIAARLLTSDSRADCAWVADEVFDWGCGEESVGYVTFGPMSLVAYLMMFAARVRSMRGDVSCEEECRAQIAAAMEAHAEICARADGFVKSNYPYLMQMDRVYVLGCGGNYGTALEGALKIGETVKVLAVGYEQDEFQHGPALQLDPTYTAFVLDGGDVTSDHASLVHRGLTLVAPNSYLIKPESLMTDEERSDRRVLGLPLACPEPFSCFYLLPVLQIVAATLSRDLDSRRSHPLYYRMTEVLDFRTKAYREDHPADED